MTFTRVVVWMFFGCVLLLKPFLKVRNLLLLPVPMCLRRCVKLRIYAVGYTERINQRITTHLFDILGGNMPQVAITRITPCSRLLLARNPVYSLLLLLNAKYVLPLWTGLWMRRYQTMLVNTCSILGRSHVP